jgi:hypothetical protein
VEAEAVEMVSTDLTQVVMAVVVVPLRRSKVHIQCKLLHYQFLQSQSESVAQVEL